MTKRHNIFDALPNPPDPEESVVLPPLSPSQQQHQHQHQHQPQQQHHFNPLATIVSATKSEAAAAMKLVSHRASLKLEADIRSHNRDSNIELNDNGVNDDEKFGLVNSKIDGETQSFILTIFGSFCLGLLLTSHRGALYVIREHIQEIKNKATSQIEERRLVNFLVLVIKQGLESNDDLVFGASLDLLSGLMLTCDIMELQVSERALMKTSIFVMNPAKWLQTATTKLTHSIRIRLARLVRSCFIKNAPRFASLGAAGWGRGNAQLVDVP